MTKTLEHAARRFAVFAEQVIQPAVFGHCTSVDAAAFQCREPISFAEARAADHTRDYCPVTPGWRWGPVWSTCWFRLTGRVPAEMAGRSVALRFSCGTEALLWGNEGPRHGLDDNHQSVILFDQAGGDEEIELFIEAACNHPLGEARFAWQETEFNRRWNTATPGILERCEIAAYDADLWRFWRTYDFARQLLELLRDDDPRGRQLCDALRRVTELIDPANVAGSRSAANEVLSGALRGGEPQGRTRCLAVGHAHIDTAWLWRLRETKRKCMRTFATVLSLMERFPDFRFLCSQAQQYAWIEQQSPELFERIASRVRSGHWEAGGAMWVEPDCNVPSGESLVRQILHGARYWREKFGDHARQRFLYLPDTFGFSAALPQIMAQAGLDTFITNKLWWNDTNEFPHSMFRWRGIDGTEVLAHLTPGRDYNATNTPAELQRGQSCAARTDQDPAGVWLQPFGYGDGGGGPTDTMILNAELAGACEGLPNVSLSRTDAFCDELWRRARAADGRDLPTWDGELYLEYHRGTYTTQAALKQANRRAEDALRQAEWLTFAGPIPPDAEAATDARRRLDESWKLLLLNQFHDILPGSSIAPVYDDARADHANIRETCESLTAAGEKTWANHADTTGMREPMIVFNPCSTPRSAVVECDGQPHFVTDVPALGVAIVDRSKATEVAAVRVDGDTLSNGIIEAVIDDAGRISSLRNVALDRDACRTDAAGRPRPLNQLVLYDDRPRAWDAWDIDAEYEEIARPVDGPAKQIRVIEDGPLRATIEVSRPLGTESRITQRFVLEAGSPRLDIHTRVDWRERRTLLRALFPVDVRARRATYEIQFGYLERPTHRNTPWDRAMFEVCAQRWMDLSEAGFGVALLNDCKYGHSCHGDVMGLSLLRGTMFPDENADIGEHEFTYSLMPHGGDWRAAGVDREAEALNTPLRAAPTEPGQTGSIKDRWAPFTITTDGAAGVTVSAIKLAEDDDRLILRLVETHGGRGIATIDWNIPVGEVSAADLLERPSGGVEVKHDFERGRTAIGLRPFQIVTVAARRA